MNSVKQQGSRQEGSKRKQRKKAFAARRKSHVQTEGKSDLELNWRSRMNTEGQVENVSMQRPSQKLENVKQRRKSENSMQRQKLGNVSVQRRKSDISTQRRKPENVSLRKPENVSPRKPENVFPQRRKSENVPTQNRQKNVFPQRRKSENVSQNRQKSEIVPTQRRQKLENATQRPSQKSFPTSPPPTSPTNENLPPKNNHRRRRRRGSRNKKQPIVENIPLRRPRAGSDPMPLVNRAIDTKLWRRASVPVVLDWKAAMVAAIRESQGKDVHVPDSILRAIYRTDKYT